jgi:membrane-associated phospholipid phosphatase
MLFLQGSTNSRKTNMTLPEQLKQWDQQLFHQINGHWNNPFLDAVLPFLRESTFWLPFYLFLLLLVISNYGRQSIWWILMILLTASLSDLISSSYLKHTFMRVRPCQDADINTTINILVNYCPRSSSFPSSHAVNHFTAAMFIYQTLKFSSKWWALMFVWAFSIIYAQVYVGVHYPFDVFCGSMIGLFIGWVMSYIYNKKFNLVPVHGTKTI